jgi:ribonuclease HIII
MTHYQSSALENNNPNALFRAKVQGVTLTLYKTGKLLLQGEVAMMVKYEIDELLEQGEVIDSPLKLAIIGSDEVGTGDYFGPVVVCCCLVPPEEFSYFMSLGVRDSKQLSDRKIRLLAPLIMGRIHYSVVTLNNPEYNEVMKIPDMNMNKIKAILHHRAIQKMLNKKLHYDRIIVDAFTTSEHFKRYLSHQAPLGVPIELIEKAEDQYLSVASASIIARFTFLEAMDSLEKEMGFPLPKGAGAPVDQVIQEILTDSSKEILYKIAKVNFKNTEKVQSKNTSF